MQPVWYLWARGLRQSRPRRELEHVIRQASEWEQTCRRRRRASQGRRAADGRAGQGAGQGAGQVGWRQGAVLRRAPAAWRRQPPQQAMPGCWMPALTIVRSSVASAAVCCLGDAGRGCIACGCQAQRGALLPATLPGGLGRHAQPEMRPVSSTGDVGGAQVAKHCGSGLSGRLGRTHRRRTPRP